MRAGGALRCLLPLTAEVFSDVVDVTGAFTGGRDAAVKSGAVTITMTSLPPAAPAGLGADDGDGLITIVYSHGAAQNPMLNAIEVRAT